MGTRTREGSHEDEGEGHRWVSMRGRRGGRQRHMRRRHMDEQRDTREEELEGRREGRREVDDDRGIVTVRLSACLGSRFLRWRRQKRIIPPNVSRWTRLCGPHTRATILF